MNKKYSILKDTNGNNINPIIWYKFDDSSSIGIDSMNRLNLGQLTTYNIPTYDTSSYIKGSGSANFAQKQTLYQTYNYSDFTNAITISFWIKINGYGSYGSYDTIMINRQNQHIFYLCRNASTTNFTITIFGSGYVNNKHLNGLFTLDYTWKYITIIAEKSGTAVKITSYLNGVLNATSTTGNWNITGLQSFELGDPTLSIIANIDDMRFYNIALTQAQIMTLYNDISYSTTNYADVIEDTKNIAIDYELIKYPTTFPESISDTINGSFNNYNQTYTINGLTYTINYSSYNTEFKNATPLYLFDGNTNNVFDSKNINLNNGGYFNDNSSNIYDYSTGSYKGDCFFNNKDIKGEWVSITYPNEFILKSYGFIAKSSLINLAPGSWILYGKDSNGNLNVIDSNDNQLLESDYNNKNNYYKRIINKNIINAKTYTFVFTKLAKSNTNNFDDNNLNFIEILMFGLPTIK